MESVATSDALVLEPAYAGFWIRLGAYLIDQLILGCAAFVLGMLVAFPTFVLVELLGRTLDADRYGDILGYAITYPLAWLYMTVFESSKFQATPGKLALRLRVTDEDGARISFRRANARFFAKIISALLCFFGFLQIAVNPRKQGLHDQLAGTLIIRSASA